MIFKLKPTPPSRVSGRLFYERLRLRRFNFKNPSSKQKACFLGYSGKHNKLGNSFKDKQYADAVELKFKKLKDKYNREINISIPFEDGQILGNRIDFIFKNIILINIKAKAKKYITHDDYREMLRYLRATNFKLGLIVNFGRRKSKSKE